MAVEEKYNIQEILNNPKSLPELAKALDVQKWQRLHSTGVGYDSWWMQRNKYLESERSYEIKKIVCAQSTTRIIEGIKKQFFKIFRAKGRVFNYNIDDSTRKAFEEKLSNVNHGMSMDDIMQDMWHNGMFEDHHAVIGVELKPIEEMEGNDPEPIVMMYPSTQVHDICIKGNDIEYLVLKWDVINAGQKRTALRFIDDEYDAVYVKEGESWVINMKDGNPDIIENPFEKVPFIMISQVRKTMFSELLKISPITNILSDLKKYLSISDDHHLCVKLHQHPLFYSYPVTCPTCNGSKTVEKQNINAGETFMNAGEDLAFTEDSGQCNTCSGKGIVPAWKADITQGISLAVAEKWEDEGYPAAQAPAGYVTNDNETLKEQRTELYEIERTIEKGVLGIEGMLETSPSRETATKVELNLQPLIDTLSSYSANAETVRKFLTDMIGKIYYGANWKGCQIFYGRKYFIRSEDNIMRELEQARKSGATISYLKELQDELTYIRFERNPEALSRAMIINEVEPYNGFTFEQVNEFKFINKNDYIIKTNIADFIERFEFDNGNIVEFVKNGNNYKKQLSEIKTKLKIYAEETETIDLSGSASVADVATGAEGR